MESIYDGYYEVDGQGHLVLFNASLCEILGLTEAQLVGDGYQKYLSDKAERSLSRMFQMVYNTGRPIKAQDFLYERPDGKQLCLEASATRVINETGFPIGIRGIIRNVTDRNCALQAQRESEQRFRSLFEQNTDAIIQFDLVGNIVDANERTAEFVGYPPAELAGWPFDVFVSTHDAMKIRRSLVYAKTGLCKEYEVRIRHRKGKQIHAHVKTIPILVDDEVTGIYAICRDITSQQHTLETIQRLSVQNTSILQSVGDGICGVDLQGKTTFFNAAAERMTGYRAEEIIGQSLHLFLHHTHADGTKSAFVDCPMHKAIHLGQKREVRNDIFWRKDKTNFPVDYHVTPMLERGKVTGAVLVFRDVTEQRQAEEWLVRSEKLSVVGQLAAGVAHEIRNPLTALKGFLQLAKVQPEKVRDYADIMYSELERIESITNEMLAFSKPHVTQFKPYNIQVLVDGVISLLSSQSLMHNVRFHVDFNHGDALILCEPDRLRQVLINLFKNAMDAMRGGGEVSIRTWLVKEQLHIAVVDHGKGMDPETLRRIGEPFYTTKSNGTGLGVMVCQRIVESHNGFMAWESEMGKGTTVTITLPICEFAGEM